MIRAERIEKIKSLAKGRGVVTWEELQECLHVSKATVQRDATLLCNASVLRKTRGGVIFLQEPDAREMSFSDRENTNRDAKRRIASAALQFVQQGAFIMLDSGSSVRELVYQLPQSISLTAITYEMATAAALDSMPNVEIYFAGGKLRKDFRACHGYFAENMLSQFHAAVCFLGADAVSLSDGISEHNMYDIRLKQIMIENSDQVVLLADRSKFTGSAFIHVAALEAVDVIITDTRLDEEALKELKKRRVQVIQVPED